MRILGFVRSGPRTGGVLLVALVVASAMAALAIGLLQVSGSAMRRQASALDTKSSFYLAEAGLAEAYGGLRVGKTGNVGTEQRPARMGDGLFWVEATAVDAKRVRLESTGMRGLGRTVLSMVVKRGEDSVASLGVFADAPLNIPAGVNIAGYDSESGVPPAELPPKKGAPAPPVGRIGSNGSIEAVGSAKSPTNLYADLAAGPQKTTSLKGVTHVGQVKPRSDAAPLPAVEVPFEPNKAGIDHGSKNTLLLTGEAVGLAHLNIAKNAHVLVTGPCNLVVNSLSVASKGILEFDTSTGPVALWVKGGLTLASGSKVSTRGTDPSRLQIQLPSAAPAKLTGTGSVFGVVYAPDGEVTVGSMMQFHGALVAKSLKLEPGARLYFDAHLDKLTSQMSLPKLVSWKIVEMATESSAQRARDPFQILGVDRESLPEPALAHEDVVLDIDYVSTSGATTAYAGWESAFDWKKVQKVLQLKRNGDDVIAMSEPAPPPPPAPNAVSQAFEADPPLQSDKLKSLLKDNSPLTEAELLRSVESLRLEDKHVRDVLRENCPVSEAVLLAAMNRPTPWDSGELEDILLDSRPLPASVLALLTQQILEGQLVAPSGLKLKDAISVVNKNGGG